MNQREDAQHTILEPFKLMEVEKQVKKMQNSKACGPDGVPPRGRPKLRYTDTIKRDIKKNGLTDVNILDRNDWRMAVSRATRRRRRAFKVRR